MKCCNRIFSARLWVVLTLMLTACVTAPALSLNLDSIATWGKFPRFCVNTYRWGDRFFNSYDSLYVRGTGLKFNVKLTADSWLDVYNFDLSDGTKIHMRSDASTSVGAHVTYLAVSVGYDINFSKLFGGPTQRRKRYSFGFNCSLFAAEWNYTSNDVGTRITKFENDGHDFTANLPFDGINVSSWNLDTYYFFNHKKYSQAAAFNFSKLQQRSQGSFYAGVSVYSQNYNFDFSSLPADMRDVLPTSWTNYKYNVRTRNYALRLGYGYNWVPHRRWLIGVSESPLIGLRSGFVNSVHDSLSFSLYNRLKLSVVWNKGRWFIGAVGMADVGLIYDKEHTLAAAILSAQISAGYRFNIW